jgi:hypothetical protein
MTGLYIGTSGILEECVLDENCSMLEGLQTAVGGYIEVVYPLRLPKGFTMIINEEGKLKGLPLNEVASWLYNRNYPQDFIVGPAVIVRENILPDGDILLGSLKPGDMRKLFELMSFESE